MQPPKIKKLFAVDIETGRLVSLFNPRRHHWSEHFIWSADKLRIIPQTAIGRATAQLLELKRERILRIRAADVSVHRHPPEDDPIQQDKD
ncbi:MAG: hypothetical protein ACREEM_45800 [Blastocatellia bacterium]